MINQILRFVLGLTFLPERWWSDHRRLYCFELPALVLGISTRQPRQQR